MRSQGSLALRLLQPEVWKFLDDGTPFTHCPEKDKGFRLIKGSLGAALHPHGTMAEKYLTRDETDIRLSRSLLTLMLVVCLCIPVQGLNAGPTKLSCVDHQGKTICHHFFEKEQIVVTPFLDGRCDEILLELIQLQSHVYIKIGKPVILAKGFCHSDHIPRMGLPEVTQSTVYGLRLSIQQEDENWKPWKYVPIMVYPRDLMTPLRHWAERNNLVVRNGSGKLTSFLEQQQIRHGSDLYRKGGSVAAFYVGEMERDDFEHTRKNIVIVLKEKIIDLPQVRGMTTTNGAHVDVEMKILDQLPDNPLVQQAFLRIFKMGMDLHTINGDQR